MHKRWLRPFWRGAGGLQDVSEHHCDGSQLERGGHGVQPGDLPSTRATCAAPFVFLRRVGTLLLLPTALLLALSFTRQAHKLSASPGGATRSRGPVD